MIDKEIMNGEPVIDGTRIPYYMIEDLIKEHYPELSLEEIVQSYVSDYYLYIRQDKEDKWRRSGYVKLGYTVGTW